MARVAILVGAAGAVVAAGVAIWLGTRGSEPVTAAAPGSAAPTPTETPPPSLPDTHKTTVTPADTPRTDPGTGSDVVTYQVDTVTVHDHRGSGATPMDVPPNMHPPAYGRKIQPTLTGKFSSQLRLVIADCAQSLPAGARGARPRVDGEIVIDIKGGHASVKRSLIQPRDVTSDGDTLKQCIEQKANALGADAPGEDDLEGYAIHVSFPILSG